MQNEPRSERITGFPPVIGSRARVLILGSMPGAVSLAKNEYYGLPHNAFWRIMGDLYGFDVNLLYDQRLKMIVMGGVALWDVLDSCYRRGSLDSAIDERTAKANDFRMLFREHCAITHVFFNGKKAASIFDKRVLPDIENEHSPKKFVTLPSTSPAFASMTLEKKREKWSVVKVASG